MIGYIKHYVNIDMLREREQKRLYIREASVGHELIVTLSAGTKPYILPLAEAGTVQLVWQTPDGTKSDTAMSVADGSEAVAVLPRALTAQAGEVRAEVRVYDGVAGTWTVSPQFVIEIQNVIYDEDAQQEIVSSPTVYEDIVASEAARVSAEEGRVSAEEGRVSAEQARADAEAARIAGGAITRADVDSEISSTSENPVQNKVIRTALEPIISMPTQILMNGNRCVSGGTIYTALSKKLDKYSADSSKWDLTPTNASTKPVTSGGLYNALDAIRSMPSSIQRNSGKCIKSSTLYTEFAKYQKKYAEAPGDWDTTPTQDSTKPVTSGGIYTVLQGISPTITMDDVPTENSVNPVKSGGIYTALAGKQATLEYDTTPTQDSQKMLKSGAIYTALGGKQDTLTFDNSPTADSSNPVKSGGVYAALQGKQNTLTFDNAPTAGSNNPVKSGGINTAIATAASALRNEIFYKAGDSFDNTGSNDLLHAYGNVRGSTSSTLRLAFPLRKLIPEGLSVNVTKVFLSSICIGSGGTVETENFDASSYIDTVSVHGNVIQVKLTKSGGWLKNGVSGDKVPQNTAVAGILRAAFSFS